MAVQKISQLTSLTSNEVTSSIDLLAIVDTTNSETKNITIDNLLSGASYNSGSFSGSFQGDGTNITGVTGEWDGSHLGDASITGSLTVTSDIIATNFTASGTITATSDISSSDKVFGDRIIVGTYVQTPTIESPTSVIRIDDNLNVVGQITASSDISSSADVYGVTGSFLHLLGDGSQLSGVTSEWDGTLDGNAEITGSLIVTGDITGSNISASNTVYGITGSFSHLLGSSPLTIESDNFTVDSSGNITSSATIFSENSIIERDIEVGRNATFDFHITRKAGASGAGQIFSSGPIGTVQTTDGTFWVIIKQIQLPQNKVHTINAKVQAINDGNSAEAAYYNIVGTFVNSSGGTGIPVNVGTKADVVAQEWDLNLNVRFRAQLGLVNIEVKGLLGTNITWAVTYDLINLIAS